MTTVHLVLGIAVLLVNGAAGLLGGWLWWRGDASRVFWPLVRTGQVLLVFQVLIGGALLALGKEPPSLHLLYGVLPLALSFVAEQFRVASAEAVLERWDLGTAREMETLPEDDQREIVYEIVRRETGVMAAAAVVVFLLALRAADVGGSSLPL